MHRSKLKHIYNKKRCKLGKLQQTTEFLRHATSEKEYFQNLNVKDLSDDNKTWKTVKRYVSNKGLNLHKMLINKKERLSQMKSN